MSIITLCTDFGTDSPYVAAMKGVVLSIAPQATIVDLTHDVPPQDVLRGAVVLDNVAWYFPEGTIHVVVVDPGVGSDRAILYMEAGGHAFVGPDNGVLSHVARKHRPTRIVELRNPEFWRTNVSNTFHGRDIMAPAAAHVAAGIDPAELGEVRGEIVELDWPAVRITPQRIDGEVIEIDSFGNVVTNITIDELAGHPTDERAVVVCHIYETQGIWRTYSDQVEGALIALVGSTGRLELALVGGNASQRLGIGLGTPVTVAWG